MDKYTYLIIINILAFILYGLDKNYAKKNKFRISEKILISIIYLGGMIGSYIGINIFHHKTKKNIFQNKYNNIINHMDLSINN